MHGRKLLVVCLLFVFLLGLGGVSSSARSGNRDKNNLQDLSSYLEEARNLFTYAHSSLTEKAIGYFGGTRTLLQCEDIEQISSEEISNIIERVISVLKTRLYLFGTPGAIVQRYGRQRVEVKLPGITDPLAIRRLVGRTGLLEFQKVVKSGPPGSELNPENRSQEVIYGRPRENGQRRPYLVQKQPLMIGDIKDARVKTSQRSRNPIYISIQFTKEGAEDFAQVITRLQPNKDRLAIVLDGIVQSAPVISQSIWHIAERDKSISRATITGDFSKREAKILTAVLKAGPFPVEIDTVESTVIRKQRGKTIFHRGLSRLTWPFIRLTWHMVR